MAAGGQRRASAGGFSRIELLVAVTILLLLAGVLLERFLYYQELAAKAQLESTVNLLRMALR
ncbi:MAG: hypothetical protein KGN39_02965, partial [Betaproteobacteria bacterium]|nr:hypothetical protein [Betaproteobacteria bacterium]